MQMLARLF
jgi:chromosome segregation ATPase